MVGKTSISGTKNPNRKRAKSREKRRVSFAASKAYDTRQIVAIHTQHREKAAAPSSMARERSPSVAPEVPGSAGGDVAR